jgi:hypothetical protein
MSVIQDPRRRSMLLVLGVTALTSTGCMTKPLRAANADGTYCARTHRRYSRKRICTPSPIPKESVEAESKRFEPTPERLTVYVIRKSWGDADNRVDLTIDGGEPITTVPESFVRLRLHPGAHALAARWDKESTMLDINGAGSEALFVELVGSAWAWGSTYRLKLGDPVSSRNRAARLRLVADVG